jgi:hypothetical protein
MNTVLNDAYYKQRAVSKKSLNPEQLIMCGLKEVFCDYKKNVVCLYLPYRNCTDMTGAILYGKRINPKVTQVHVFEDGHLINIYAKKSDEWIAASYTRAPSPDPHQVLELIEE